MQGTDILEEIESWGNWNVEMKSPCLNHPACGISSLLMWSYVLTALEVDKFEATASYVVPGEQSLTKKPHWHLDRQCQLSWTRAKYMIHFLLLLFLLLLFLSNFFFASIFFCHLHLFLPPLSSCLPLLYFQTVDSDSSSYCLHIVHFPETLFSVLCTYHALINNRNFVRNQLCDFVFM